MKNLLMGMAYLVALAALVYAVALRFSAGPFAAHPQTGFIVAICALVAGALFWTDYWRPVPSGVPRPGDVQSIEPTPAQKRPVPSMLGVLMIGVLIADIYLRHTYLDEHVVWVDSYWSVILPVLLAASALYWLYDTFRAPLKTRLRLGRTSMEMRQVFVLKRLLLLTLAFAILLLVGPQGAAGGVYAGSLPQAMLAGIWSCWASLVLVMR